jgi:hypothetical protein
MEFSVVDLSKSKDKRDFGSGFYTTTIKKQAEEWAIKMSNRYRNKYKYIYTFELDITDDMKIKRFDGLTEGWLEFVMENRTKCGLQHSFDIVQGPVANDKTTETIAYYIDGIYSAAEALNRFRYMRPNDQVSLHTEKALKHLLLLEVEKHAE